MKPTRLFALWIIGTVFVPMSRAQDWAPLHPADTVYFTSLTDSLAEVVYSLDSIQVSGTDTFWTMVPSLMPAYEFHGQSGINSNTFNYLDSSWHWLGKKVIRKENGSWQRETGGILYTIHPSATLMQKWPYGDADSAWISWKGVMTVMGSNDSALVLRSLSGDSVVLSKNHGVISYRSPLSGSDKTFRLIGSERAHFGLQLPGFHEMYDYRAGDILSSRYDSDQGNFVLNTRKFHSRVEIKSVQHYADSVVIVADRYWRFETLQSFPGYEESFGMDADLRISILREKSWLRFGPNSLFDEGHLAGRYRDHHFQVGNSPEETKVSRLLLRNGRTYLYCGEGARAPFNSETFLRRNPSRPEPLYESVPLQDDNVNLTGATGYGEIYMHWKHLYYNEYYTLLSYIRGNDTLFGPPYEKYHLNPVPEPPKARELRIHPNPGQGVIYLNTAFEHNLEYTVFSMDGREILKGNLETGKTRLDLQLPPGVYSILFLDSRNQWSFKYVVTE